MDKTANTRPHRLRSAWSFVLELFSTGHCLVWWVRVTVIVIVKVAIRVSTMSWSNYNPQPLEVEAAARALKMGMSQDDDGIPVELLKHAGDEIVTMSTGMTTHLANENLVRMVNKFNSNTATLSPNESKFRLFQNYRTISLDSHPSMVIMVRVMLN